MDEGPADAPAVLLANSLGTTLDMWAPQVPALAARFRVLRYDLRGHGGSAIVPGPCTIADLGRDMLEVLDRAGVERAHVAGLSLGGMAAMWVASEAPARVGRLVLCSTAASLAPATFWRDRAATVRAQGTIAVADLVLSRWFTPAFAGAHRDTVERMRSMLLSIPAEGYASCAEVIADLDLVPRLVRIAAPTLVIAGADDAAVDPRLGAQLHAAIAGAHLEVVPDAAHLLNVERAEVVSRLMLDHLTV